MKKIIVSLLILFVVAVLSFFVFQTYGSKGQLKKNETQNQEETISSETNTNTNTTNISINPILLPNQDDIILGDENAKIVMVEYASLSCPHCADFHSESFSKIKQEYVENGKIKFIYRNFPLNQPALAAAVVSECYSKKFEGAEKAQKYHDFIKALFKTQESWAFNENFFEKLESIAKLSGLSGTEFKSCLDDTKIKERILNHRLIASQNLQIDSTPTFFINGEKIGGYSNYTNIKNIIEKHLQ